MRNKRSAKKPLFVGLCLVGGAFLFSAERSATAEKQGVGAEAPSAEQLAAVKREIQRLGDETAEVRVEATKKLADMDLALLPWLENELKANEAKWEEEVKTRLRQVVAAMRVRAQTLRLRTGTPVDLHLNQTDPVAVLAALEKETGIVSPAGLDALPWRNDKRDFQWRGSYWGAVEKIAELFPLGADPAGDLREDLTAARRLDRWLPADWRSLRSPSVMAGLCRLRLARVAKEREKDRTFLTVTLLPAVEAGWFYEELTVTIDEALLDGKTKLLLAPAERKLPKDAPKKANNFIGGGAMQIRMVGAANFAPGGDAREDADALEGPLVVVPTRDLSWEAPLPDEAKALGKLTLRGTVKAVVRERKRIDLDLTAGDASATPEEGRTLSLRKDPRNNQWQAQVSGAGDQTEAEAFFSPQNLTLLNKDGKPVFYRFSGNSMTTSNNAWTVGRHLSVNEEVVKACWVIPGEKREAVMPFEFSAAPLP